MFRTVNSVHHQEFFTVHTAIHTGLLTACGQDQDVRPDPARKLYEIYRCCVYSEKFLMMDRVNCPKHVEFNFKNKFEKLMHLIGFIIRML